MVPVLKREENPQVSAGWLFLRNCLGIACCIFRLCKHHCAWAAALVLGCNFLGIKAMPAAQQPAGLPVGEMPLKLATCLTFCLKEAAVICCVHAAS